MPYYRVKPYESYIEYFPNSNQAGGHIPAGQVFQCEHPDEDQLYKLEELSDSEVESLSTGSTEEIKSDVENAESQDQSAPKDQKQEPAKIDAKEEARRKLREMK